MGQITIVDQKVKQNKRSKKENFEYFEDLQDSDEDVIEDY